MNRSDRLEELGRVLDRHIEHLGNGLALVMHLECLAVVARALAYLARHVHVGQEVHLDLEGAITRTRFAAATFDVERESAGLVSANLGLGGGGEQRADLVEDAGVGGRIGARGATDRRLVDPHQFVDVFEAVDPGVPAGHLTRSVETVGQHGGQDVVHQSGLAGTRHSRHRSQHTEWE